MKTRHYVLLAILAASLFLFGIAFGQEILQGKTHVATGTCQVDKQYAISDKSDTVVRNCLVFMDPTIEGVGWILVLDKYDDPVAIVEFTSKGDQRVVWRKGHFKT